MSPAVRNGISFKWSILAFIVKSLPVILCLQLYERGGEIIVFMCSNTLFKNSLWYELIIPLKDVHL